MNIVDILQKIAGLGDCECVFASNYSQSPTLQFKKLMNEKFRSFSLWANRVFNRIPESNQQQFFSLFEIFEEQINKSYQEHDWAKFQALIAEAKNVLSRVHDPQGIVAPLTKHWIYEVWSDLLNKTVYFVCCDKEITTLIAAQGIGRESIYTEAELKELLDFVGDDKELLKLLHEAKLLMEGDFLTENAKENFLNQLNSNQNEQNEENEMGKLAEYANKNSRWLKLKDGAFFIGKYLGFDFETDGKGRKVPSFRFEDSDGNQKVLNSQSAVLCNFFDEDEGDAKPGDMVKITRHGVGSETRYSAEVVTKGDEPAF